MFNHLRSRERPYNNLQDYHERKYCHNYQYDKRGLRPPSLCDVGDRERSIMGFERSKRTTFEGLEQGAADIIGLRWSIFETTMAF